MSDITINYKGSAIATMDASGTKTLLTEGKYCEDDLEVVYVKPGGGGGYDWSWVKNDGKTYLYITVGEYWKEYKLKYYQTTTSAVTVNWGDGNTDTTTTKNHQTLTHTYASSSDYTITITPTNDNLAFYSHINDGSSVAYRHYNNMLVKAEIGRCAINVNNLLDKCNCLEALAYMGDGTLDTSNYVTFGTQLVSLKHYKQANIWKIYGVKNSLIEEFPYNKDATKMGPFLECRALKKAHIPKVDGIDNTCFQDCWALEEVVFDTPISFTSINGSCFARCYALRSITIPEGVTSLGGNFFYSCTGLEYVSLPSTLASIPSGWNDCGSVKELHIAATTPPTLGGTYFSPFPADWVLYVPRSENHTVLAAYQSATNWSTYASHMQEEPA